MDSAKAYADYPVVPGLSRAWRGPFKQIRTFDYVTLAKQNSALAEIFQKNGLRPNEFWPMQVTLVRNALRVTRRQESAGSKPLDAKASTAVKNTAFVEAHKAELTKLGIDF
jgi:hypothetical protein